MVAAMPVIRCWSGQPSEGMEKQIGCFTKNRKHSSKNGAKVHYHYYDDDDDDYYYWYYYYYCYYYYHHHHCFNQQKWIQSWLVVSDILIQVPRNVIMFHLTSIVGIEITRDEKSWMQPARPEKSLVLKGNIYQ